MSGRLGLGLLFVSLLVAAVCGALIARRLYLRAHLAYDGVNQPAIAVKPAPALKVRLAQRPASETIDLPGDPILLPRRAIGAPRELAIDVPAHPEDPPTALSRAFFIASPLVPTESGTMIRFSGGGQDAQALRQQLAENMAALNGLASDEGAMTDDDGGAATPEHAELQALTDANSNRVELAPPDAPSVKTALIKAFVADRVSDLLSRNGFTEESAAQAEDAVAALTGLQALAQGGELLASGVRDAAGGYRVAAVAIYQGREYVGAVGLAENGTYAEAAAPRVPREMLQDDIENAGPAGFVVADGLYSSGLASGAPEAVVREAIQMLAARIDMGAPLAADGTFDLLYTADFRDTSKHAGKTIFVRVKNGGTDFACYAVESPDSLFRCFTPSLQTVSGPARPARSGEEPPPLPPSRFQPVDSGASARGGVLAPIRGAPVTSLFGMRFHPILHYWRLHAGIDFGAPVGSPVRAAADGVVEIAGPVSGYGNHVRLNHKGFGTSYSHLSDIVEGVKVGAEVKQGQLIAYSGNTGLSTGPHLHFEYYIDGEAVDPLPHLGTEANTGAALAMEPPHRTGAAPTASPRATPSAATAAFPAFKARIDKVLASLQ